MRFKKRPTPGLYAAAANGLVDLANTLTFAGQFPAAEAHLVRAAELANTRHARRTEARAQLQRANLRLSTGEWDEAIRLSIEPLQFFTTNHYLRPEADGKNIQSRAYESLENYGEAARLATEVLKLAESIEDESIDRDVAREPRGAIDDAGPAA